MRRIGNRLIDEKTKATLLGDFNKKFFSLRLRSAYLVWLSVLISQPWNERYTRTLKFRVKKRREFYLQRRNENKGLTLVNQTVGVVNKTLWGRLNFTKLLHNLKASLEEFYGRMNEWVHLLWNSFILSPIRFSQVRLQQSQTLYVNRPKNLQTNSIHNLQKLSHVHLHSCSSPPMQFTVKIVLPSFYFSLSLIFMCSVFSPVVCFPPSRQQVEAFYSCSFFVLLSGIWIA